MLYTVKSAVRPVVDCHRLAGQWLRSQFRYSASLCDDMGLVTFRPPWRTKNETQRHALPSSVEAASFKPTPLELCR